VQRHCSATRFSFSKNLRLNRSALAVRPGRAAAPGTITANHAEYTKRIRVFRVVRGQEKSLRHLNLTLSLQTCERRRTPELSHAGPRTQADPRLPGKPGALPGVGSSDLVRQSNTHRLRKLRSDSPPKTRWRQAHRGARNVTEKPTEHTKRNLRRRRGRAQPPNSTGGNRGNRGSTPSQFAPLPPVQNAQRCSLMPNLKQCIRRAAANKRRFCRDVARRHDGYTAVELSR